MPNPQRSLGPRTGAPRPHRLVYGASWRPPAPAEEPAYRRKAQRPGDGCLPFGRLDVRGERRMWCAVAVLANQVEHEAPLKAHGSKVVLGNERRDDVFG